MHYRFIILFSFLFNISLAGTTGKLSGIITETNSDNVLIGCNIIINGTDLGTASDINGDHLSEFLLTITANKESQTIYSNRPLVTFKNGNYWTAKETYEKLENLSPRQYKRINSMDNLMNIIRGLAAREQMLVHAEKLELSNHTRFTGLLENHYHSYLVNECLERLFDHNEQLDQHPDLKHSIYKEFRDGLAENALISIDSSAIKKFILPLGESS